MSKTTIDLKDLDDLLCKYGVKDLEDLESRLNQEFSFARRLRCEGCKNLEAKLAEKEKEIDILKKDYEFVAKQYKELMRTGDFIIEQKDQDKISFAVEQLEKVKELIHSHEKIYLSLNDFKIINEIFDNQIKQLREGK